MSNILITTWGLQNYSQIIVFTDCGIGFGATSLKTTIASLKNVNRASEASGDQSDGLASRWIPFPYPSKLSFVCLGCPNDSYFSFAVKLYQDFLEVSGQIGQVFVPKSSDDSADGILTGSMMCETIDRMCDLNYKPFEASLKCGSYFKLESAIIIWPPPLPYTVRDPFAHETTKIISRKLEICGYVNISDIGSPKTVSRHLILPGASDKGHADRVDGVNVELDKLEVDIKAFYARSDGNNTDDEEGESSQVDSTRESICVLLHGALKVENMAALVLLNDDWFGFIYSYADGKKKSNLMLTILPPGYDIIPWMGDLCLLGTAEDALPIDSPQFPVKPEKRSYSQNCVVWIKPAGLQSDIQKVMRHAKKLPEKTQHFYKELNRIRRAALALGFVELLDGLSCILERESQGLPPTASESALQLNHAAMELRKLNNRDLKCVITALPSRFST